MSRIRRIPKYWFGRKDGYKAGWLIIWNYPPGKVYRERTLIVLGLSMLIFLLLLVM